MSKWNLQSFIRGRLRKLAILSSNSLKNPIWFIIITGTITFLWFVLKLLTTNGSSVVRFSAKGSWNSQSKCNALTIIILVNELSSPSGKNVYPRSSSAVYSFSWFRNPWLPFTKSTVSINPACFNPIFSSISKNCFFSISDLSILMLSRLIFATQCKTSFSPCWRHPPSLCGSP